jgi:signal transduction histidine kinase
MPWQFTPYTVPFVVVAGAVLFAALYVVRQQRKYEPVPGGYLAVALSVAVAYTVVVSAVELSAIGRASKLFWRKLALLGGIPAPALLFFFTLGYTENDEYLDRRRAAVIMVLPVVTILLAFTNGFHGLVWTSSSLVSAGQFDVLLTDHALFSYTYGSYGYLLVVVSIALLLRRAIDEEGIYRRQAIMLGGGAFVPLLAAGVYVAGTNPFPALNLALFSFVVTALTFSWGVARHGLFTLVPIASQTAVQQMNDAIIVIDVRGLVVNVNQKADDFLTTDVAEAPGQSIGAVLRPLAVPPAPLDATESYHENVTDEETGKHYQRTSTPLTDDDGILLGQLVGMRDITERVRREERLRQQNEQLEQFASVVSHDLRNPLNVLSARTQLARETGKVEHFDAIEAAANRMDQLIDDLLQLARQGQTVGETAEVNLRDVAEDAWATVEAPLADFEIVGDTAFEADPDRLQQAFENLFRNAVDHVGQEVAIRVEPLEDGFAVEDDGPGIPADERADSFEYGHTTAENGTGFGLSIVSEVVDAHDWDIAVTDGSEGGARFEITGVTTARRVSMDTAEEAVEFEEVS